MSLYPSLEDMKMDQMTKAQISFQSQIVPERPSYLLHQHAPPTAPLYPTLGGASPPPPYSISPSAPPTTAKSTSPSVPPTSLSLYPSLDEFMGLELSPAVIRENMPEYAASVQVAQEISPPGQIRNGVSPQSNVIAPLSGQALGLQRAQVTHGLREVTLCKDGSGKVGIRVTAINKGVFVCLVSKNSPAALCGIRFGDQILQINGVSVAGYSMDQVHDIFRKAHVNGISVIVRDRPFERTVTLHKDSVGQVGFQFKNGQITGLVKDSSAARNGLLTEHHLLEVDGQNVIGQKDKEISLAIDRAESVVTVTVIPSFIYTHMMKKIAPNLIKSSMDHSVPNV